MTAPDVVPLPARLAECGCPRAKTGTHLTSCVPAREHEKIPLHEREGVVLGQRYQAVMWEYPLTFHADIHVTVDVDPLLYITQHRAEYDAYEVEGGCQEWEKPAAFIAHLIGEDLDDCWTRFGHPLWVSRDHSYVDEIRESPPWTPELTELLLAALPAPVDPNQGTLLPGEATDGS